MSENQTRRHTSAELAKRAYDLRKAKGLTLQAVADKLGVSRQSIHSAEKQDVAGMDALRVRIIEALGETVVEGPVYIERPRELFDQVEQESGGAEEQKSKAA